MKNLAAKIFKIKTDMKYSLKQYAVYAVLTCFTDKANVSHISRETISKLSGVKDLDTISKYTNMFEKDGLLRKQIKYSQTGKRLVEYIICEPTSGYTLCSNKLFSGNPDLIGFLCLLADLKNCHTNEIKLTASSIIRKLGIGRTAFYKYIKLALQDGSVTKTNDGYVLSEELFPITNSISHSVRCKINSVLMSSNESRAKRMLLTYYNPVTDEFDGLKGSVEDFLDFCISGVPRRQKERPKEANIEKINIKF